MDTQAPHPNYRIFITIVALLAIGIWLISVFLYRQKKDREEIAVVPVVNVSEAEVSAAPILNRGSVELAQQRANPQVGQPLELTVTANSENQDVVGYDILVKYDQNAFAFVGATSLVPSFSVVPVAKDGLVSLTGSKSPSVKTPTVFSNTDIVRLTFTAKKKGTYDFSALSISGNQKSRLVDAKLEKLYPKTSLLEVKVD